MNKQPLIHVSRTVFNVAGVRTIWYQNAADSKRSANENPARNNDAFEVTAVRMHQYGFTLIELMITVAIVAILAGIAYPSYTGYMTRTHRVEAKSALVQIAAAQERNYLANSTYTTTVASVYGGPTNYFDFTIPTADATTFTVTATAKGSQLRDVDCKTFSINSAGAKTAKKSDGTTANDAACWRQ